MNTENNTINMKIDFSKLLGTWVNTYENSRGIERVVITEEEGKIGIRCFGVDGGILPGDWGMTHATPLAKTPEKAEVVAFKGEYKKDDFDAFLAVNDNKGLLIIAAYFYFKVDNGMNDFFAREFYYLAD